MKRFLILALVCLLLCGCTAQPQPTETTQPTETQPMTDPTEPSGCYDPDSTVELQYRGAVKAYPLGLENVLDMVCIGEDVVVFSGMDTTTLTMLSGENLYVTAQVELDVWINPQDASTQITDKGISYYDGEAGQVVLLDAALKEVARIPVPEDIVGAPVLSANRQFLYYCTADSIRVLELEHGIRRLLMEVTSAEQTAHSLLMEDTLLRCQLMEEDGSERTVFISTETGEIQDDYWAELKVESYGDTYYASFAEGALQALVYGKAGGDQRMLIPEDLSGDYRYLPEKHAVVGASRRESTLVLDYYDLSSGLRSSVLELHGCSMPMGLAAGEGNLVYVLCYDENRDGEVLYRWDTLALASNDSGIYTGPRYTMDKPDTEGLSACRAYATELNQRYGVEILIFTDATAHQPWDYTLAAEYQAPLIRRDLETLDRLLAVYPANFLKQTADSTSSGVLRICLVRSITGTPESGSMENVGGLQFWIDEEPYVALCVGQMYDGQVYHEIFHAIETKVYSDSQIYYEWDKLNPDGFEYDYNYQDYLNHWDSEYLKDETRAFIDSYSMTFPKEDRARIMEYAMTPGNESYFQSEIMQEKLYQLCLGIRKAYKLTKSEETYPWEQYLNESLAYVPK